MTNDKYLQSVQANNAELAKRLNIEQLTHAKTLKSLNRACEELATERQRRVRMQKQMDAMRADYEKKEYFMVKKLCSSANDLKEIVTTLNLNRNPIVKNETPPSPHTPKFAASNHGGRRSGSEFTMPTIEEERQTTIVANDATASHTIAEPDDMAVSNSFAGTSASCLKEITETPIVTNDDTASQTITDPLDMSIVDSVSVETELKPSTSKIEPLNTTIGAARMQVIDLFEETNASMIIDPDSADIPLPKIEIKIEQQLIEPKSLLPTPTAGPSNVKQCEGKKACAAKNFTHEISASKLLSVPTQKHCGQNTVCKVSGGKSNNTTQATAELTFSLKSTNTRKQKAVPEKKSKSLNNLSTNSDSLSTTDFETSAGATCSIEDQGRTRLTRKRKPIDYKEPSLNTKMRRANN